MVDGGSGAFAVGEVVAGRYEIRATPHRGPIGLEYRALDREVEVEVALLVPAAGLFTEPARAERLVGAVQALRGVVHPFLRRVFDAVATPAGPALAAQLGDRDALERRRLGGQPASEAELVALASALGEALGAAADQGCLHGWLTPFDLIEVGGQLKLANVGVMAHAALEAARSAYAAVAHHIAPETWSSGLLSPQGDVYALGVLLAEAAAGRVGPELAETLAVVGRGNPALAALLARATAAQAVDRPAHPRALVAELARLLVDERVPTMERAIEVPEAARLSPPPGESMPGLDAVGPLYDGAEPTIQDDAPLFKAEAPRPAEPQVGVWSAPSTAARLELVSMKPDAVAARPPVVAVVDRPEMQPVVRPLDSLRRSSAPPGALGHYAPPRAARPAVRRGRWPIVAAVAVVVAVAAAAGVWLALRGGVERMIDPGWAAALSPPPPPPPPAVAPIAPCPPGMALVEGVLLGPEVARFCVDRWESPGPGAAPAQVELAAAAASCAERGARLCGDLEWEDACRGPERGSWPYGAAFVVGRCNVRGTAVEVAGARPTCQSAATALDMSGNLAEWSAEGTVRGGAFDDGSDGRCSQRGRARPGTSLGFRCCADPLASPGVAR